MLELAAKKGIKSWIREVPIGPEGCAEVVTKVNDNKLGEGVYRFVSDLIVRILAVIC